MPKTLTEAIAALEQVESGMIDGRVAAPGELEAARTAALDYQKFEIQKGV